MKAKSRQIKRKCQFDVMNRTERVEAPHRSPADTTATRRRRRRRRRRGTSL